MPEPSPAREPAESLSPPELLKKNPWVVIWYFRMHTTEGDHLLGGFLAGDAVGGNHIAGILAAVRVFIQSKGCRFTGAGTLHIDHPCLNKGRRKFPRTPKGNQCTAQHRGHCPQGKFLCLFAVPGLFGLGGLGGGCNREHCSAAWRRSRCRCSGAGCHTANQSGWDRASAGPARHRGAPSWPVVPVSGARSFTWSAV